MPDMYPQASSLHGAGASSTHPGMFNPGIKIQVGKHRVIVEKYLSEGGFAHVYLVRDPGGGPSNVLKRVAVPDKDALANMRTEVETMKKLKGHKHIVTYIDSHASQLQGGGYEVFLLMEFCNGGGLIDFMNTRLQVRLTEPEILKIFSDVALGVACMHYLKPPLLHRDLKVENVLITTHGSSRTYKLCDFGSTAPPRPAAKNATEGRLIEDDIQRHTTLQYRSPEMIDVYRRQPIDEKSDIWALGVLLYKLCYYTTPFEDQGQMAILNASFKFPSYPSFSDKLKKLISSCLRENPQQRPNIYQVVKEVSLIRNTDCPIQDIYATRTQSETRRYEQLPPSDADVASPPLIGISKIKSSDLPSQASLPDIAPMRRGRPMSTQQTLNVQSARVTPAGSRGTSSDPFAALDSKDVKVRSQAVDEMAAKFPSLDEFSLLHDQGSKFEFSQDAPVDQKRQSINHKVTAALADEAFGQAPAQSPRMSSLKHVTSAPASNKSSSTDLRRNVSLRKPEAPRIVQPTPEIRTQSSLIQETIPIHKSSRMVSTGVQTSPSASPSPPKRLEVSSKPVWRVPAGVDERSSSLPDPRHTPSTYDTNLPPRPEKSGARPSVLELSRTKSATLGIPQSPASSRPSLEGQRPSPTDLPDPIARARSVNSRPRPVSAYVESREPETYDKPLPPRPEVRRSSSVVESSDEEGPEPVGSNLSFLKDMEQEKQSRRRSSGKSHHKKHVSSISLSGTKNLITGRFGDAFKKFEGGKHHDDDSPHRHGSHGSHTRHYDPHDNDSMQPHSLTPIAGSVATGSVADASDIAPLEETEDLPPELRRELERQQLEAEERRVAAAAAAYKNKLADPRDKAAAQQKGSAIQNRVKELLSTAEARDAEAPKRTAEGYGRFTGEDAPARAAPPVARKPVGIARTASPTVAVANNTGPRPMVAPKPRTLVTGGRGVVTSESRPSDGPSAADEDWESSFQKRYPSLSGLEMVETEVGRAARVRDV